MKTIKILTALIFFLAASTTLFAQNKRYEVKSGIIEYTISSSGNMMGMDTSGKGSAKTVFKEWGAVELHSESSKMLIMGQTQTTREMTKIENGKVFVVNFDEKVIYEYTPAMLAKSEYKDLVKTGKEALESMGGKKISEEKFMGYACEVWEMMHVKLWLHKGMMLKSEATIMGMKHTTTATKVALDTSVSEGDLKLPDYPVKKAEAGMMEEAPQLTPEQMQQMQEMMKNFSSKQ